MTPLEQSVALEREAFLHGDCWWLALTLRRLFGFTMVFTVYWPEDAPPAELTDWSWDHVFVETHAGVPLDVEGIPNLHRWRQAPDGYERGFHLTREDAEIHALLEVLVDAELRPRPGALYYVDVDPLSVIVRLAWHYPEAFLVLPLLTPDDLPDRLRSVTGLPKTG